MPIFESDREVAAFIENEFENLGQKNFMEEIY